jgi:hypothetical protein
MQPPTAADSSAHAPDPYVVRPAGVLAELLEESEMGEDELLLKLREAGLITYASPLLTPLLEEWSDVFAAEVLARLEPTDVVLFGQANRACRAAVVAFGVPQEEPQEEVETSDDDGDNIGSTGVGAKGGPLLLRVEDFVGSIERLAWAKTRGCSWDEDTCAYVAGGGNVEVLKWAWERRCPWNSRVCSAAAGAGHLEALQWARAHGCEWDEATCSTAAGGGHLVVLRWAHEQGCPWCALTSSNAAACGHLHVLQWAREQGCPWDSLTCSHAAMCGHLEVLKWARAHHCPWTAATCTHAVQGGHLDVLNWARKHNCPWTAATRDKAGATMGYFDNLPQSV